MGRYEDYMEMHGNDRWEEDEEEIDRRCAVCGTDYGKLYYFEGEYLCEDCLLEKYYNCDAHEIPTIVFCERCGEPIEHEVYCVQNGNGDCVFYDEECLLDTAND